MESRRGTAIPDATVEAGLAQSSESGRLAEWILEMISSESGRSC
jgi:hypothetical protein